MVDQGSTNGSFIGDEKLIPGKKYLLKVSEIARIGHQISLELVTEADSFLELPKPKLIEERESAAPSSDHDKTQIISLDQLKHSKAMADEARRKIQAEKRLKELAITRDERKKMVRIVFIAFAILVVGIWANKKWKAGLSVADKDTIVKKIQTKFQSSSEIDADLEGYRIPRGLLLTRKVFLKNMTAKKCVEEDTHPLCATNDLRLKHNGVIVDGMNTMIYVEESFWFERARALSGSGLSEENLRKIAFLIFLEDHSLELGRQGTHLYVIFYKYESSKVPEVTYTCAVKSDQIELLIDSSKKEDLEEENDKVEKSFQKLGIYFNYY